MVIPRFNIVASGADLKHDLRVTRNALEAASARLDRIELELETLIKFILSVLSLKTLRVASNAGDQDSLNKVIQSHIKSSLGETAPDPVALGPSLVAHNLMMKPLPDGYVEFSINGGATFTLPPRLGGVLQFLASGDEDPSGLVSWRSRMEIIAFLEKCARRRFTTNYINGMVYRLRQALQKAGYDPRLIQSSRQKGIRLAFIHGRPDAHSSPHD